MILWKPIRTITWGRGFALPVTDEDGIGLFAAVRHSAADKRYYCFPEIVLDFSGTRRWSEGEK